MARIFEKLDEWELFVPDIGDERALYRVDPDNALTVEIRYLTSREATAYDRILNKVRTTDDVPRMAEESASKLFTENVRNIRNYGPNGDLLTTGEQLWADGEVAVVNAIAGAIRDRSHLEAGLAKKLRQSSAGEVRATSPGGGVRGATPASSPDSPETPTPKTPSSGLTTTPSEPIETATVTEVHSTMRPQSTGGAPGPS